MMMAARKGRAAPRQDVAQDRRAAQIYPLERAVGRGIIGEQRKNSTHLRRPRRAILTPSRTKLRTNRRPDRQDLSLAVREFEAESVSYLVCTRLGIDTASDEYLAGYVSRCPATPPISLDRIMKSVWLLEQMGRACLGARKPAN